MTHWQTTERCSCGAVGDMIDAPLFVGECDTCDRETCTECGTVEGDPDGNLRTCKPCEVEA